jgi:hypothetical protein
MGSKGMAKGAILRSMEAETFPGALNIKKQPFPNVFQISDMLLKIIEKCSLAIGSQTTRGINKELYRPKK